MHARIWHDVSGGGGGGGGVVLMQSGFRTRKGRVRFLSAAQPSQRSPRPRKRIGPSAAHQKSGSQEGVRESLGKSMRSVEFSSGPRCWGTGSRGGYEETHWNTGHVHSSPQAWDKTERASVLCFSLGRDTEGCTGLLCRTSTIVLARPWDRRRCFERRGLRTLSCANAAQRIG